MNFSASTSFLPKSDVAFATRGSGAAGSLEAGGGPSASDVNTPAGREGTELAGELLAGGLFAWELFVWELFV